MKYTVSVTRRRCFGTFQFKENIFGFYSELSVGIAHLCTSDWNLKCSSEAEGGTTWNPPLHNVACPMTKLSTIISHRFSSLADNPSAVRQWSSSLTRTESWAKKTSRSFWQERESIRTDAGCLLRTHWTLRRLCRNLLELPLALQFEPTGVRCEAAVEIAGSHAAVATVEY